MRTLLSGVLSAAALVLGACTPIVNINVMPPEERFRPQVVLEEGGGGSRVAVIEVRGLIMDGRTPGLIMDGPNPVDRFAAQLTLAEKDPAVKALIVRITSPGGTVTASHVMHEELRRFSRVSGKPVVASIGEVGASGGYYLALGADTIMAEPTSITGSIGVIMPTVNVSEGLAMIGIRSRSITSGPNKDLANPMEPIRDAQYAVLQGMVDEMYARFRGLVVERRPGLASGNLDMATDGRVFMGERAKELGLVDELGGLREAFARAKEMAGLERATLVKYADPATPPRSIYSAAGESEREINLVQVKLGAGALRATGTAPFYYLWAPGGLGF
ncbi:MAG: signal peptide peptidase SppA [Phycisphaerales bacterium]|nr:signal peptide peptidase SppA [Phycisphaerales bacterium]